MWKWKVGPLQYRVVRSDPIQVGTSRLSMIARVISYTRRRATIGEDTIRSHGVQFVDVSPVAVMAEQRGWRRLLPVVNLTNMLIGALAGVCLASYVASRAVGKAIEDRTTPEA